MGASTMGLPTMGENTMGVDTMGQKQVTIPFPSPITIYDYTVKYINTKEKYFIAVEMDIGYWKVVA